ncbi:MAG: hypothetical protein RL684_2650 [Pseudomonadota bacterium]|jgi:hypothetical protein
MTGAPNSISAPGPGRRRSCRAKNTAKLRGRLNNCPCGYQNAGPSDHFAAGRR